LKAAKREAKHPNFRAYVPFPNREVGLESNGVGSKFWIELPAAPSE
jgi:hypothetical protein